MQFEVPDLEDGVYPVVTIEGTGTTHLNLFDAAKAEVTGVHWGVNFSNGPFTKALLTSKLKYIDFFSGEEDATLTINKITIRY